VQSRCESLWSPLLASNEGDASRRACVSARSHCFNRAGIAARVAIAAQAGRAPGAMTFLRFVVTL